MNIVILGPGAIGSLWAIKLKQAGHNVSLWSRSSESQLKLQLDDSDVETFANHHLADVKNADLIVVTVKAWQVEEAIRPLVAHINPDTIIMLMHNGMGTAQHVEAVLTNNPIVLAPSTHGAYNPS